MANTPSPRVSLDGASSGIALSRYQSALTLSVYSATSVAVSGNNTVYYVKVVFPKAKNRFMLIYLAVIASDNGEDVMVALHELHANEASSGKILNFIRSLFWTTVIEIATLSSFSSTFLEAQNEAHEVIIESRATSAEFTAAFQHPSSLHISGSFVDYRPTLIASPTSREALLFTQRLNKESVFWGFCAAMVLSVCVGIVVGVVWNAAALGVETATGLITGISVFGGLLLWFSK